MINRRGSTAVVLAITFVCLMVAVVASIGISRRMVVSSECRVFGDVWGKAILSEYDIHLLEDYGILAYQGPDSEVDRKLNIYLDYSARGKLDADIGKANSNLAGYEMNNPANFKRAIRDSFAATIIDGLISDEGRRQRTEPVDTSNRVIRNRVVLDTLPSKGMESSIDIKAVGKALKSENMAEYAKEKAGGAIVEINFVKKHFNNHLSVAGDKETYFANEWEYVVAGKPDDSANFRECKEKIFLLRNVLNLAYLATDPEKQAAIMTAAELITPGPGAPVTALLIAELWAAAESEYDLKSLLEGKRVPLMKTPATWATDLDGIIFGNEMKGKLDDEALENLEKNKEEIKKADGGFDIAAEISEGQTYEDYVLILMLTMNENVRLLRIMDIVQIDMKYRYYEDFNLEEYYRGVRFNIKANGKDYEISKAYQ